MVDIEMQQVLICCQICKSKGGIVIDVFLHFYLMMKMETWAAKIFFWLHFAVCRILVPQPGIEPVPSALGVQSLNPWIAREVPRTF